MFLKNISEVQKITLILFFSCKDTSVHGHIRRLQRGAIGKEIRRNSGPLRRHQTQPDHRHHPSDAEKLRPFSDFQQLLQQAATAKIHETVQTGGQPSRHERAGPLRPETFAR